MFSSQHEKVTLSSPTPPALESEGLRKSYGQRKQRFEAVSGVSLKLEPGEVLAFLGPNGAGKTTTIKMIAGLIRPDAGWVRIAGLNPHRQPEALSGIGAVLEGNRNLYWRLTALENLEYFGVLRKMPRKRARSRGLALLDTFGLLDKKKEPVQNLSRGMQQKIAIAVALIHEPQLLLLDEPTLGLDVEAGETVKAIVRQVAASGCAILLTTHQLNVAEALSDRVAIIRAGQIVTEQNTQDLIRQFSRRGAYRIEFEGTLSAAQRQEIVALGGSVGDRHIHFLPPTLPPTLLPNVNDQANVNDQGRQPDRSPAALAATTLYKIFQVLDPLPLVDVRQDRADLTDVFLQVIQQK